MGKELGPTEIIEIHPELPLEDQTASWDMLVTPTTDPVHLSFFEAFRRAPLANKLRASVALGTIALATVGSVMFGVHLQNEDEERGRNDAALKAASLSTCLTFVHSVAGTEPKIITANLIPPAIQDDCGITQKLKDAKNADQARGMPAAQPFEPKVEDTSGVAMRLPSETSLKNEIAQLEVAANDHNPTARIVLGFLSGLGGLVVGGFGVAYASERLEKARSKRIEIKMKTREDYR